MNTEHQQHADEPWKYVQGTSGVVFDKPLKKPIMNLTMVDTLLFMVSAIISAAIAGYYYNGLLNRVELLEQYIGADLDAMELSERDPFALEDARRIIDEALEMSNRGVR